MEEGKKNSILNKMIENKENEEGMDEYYLKKIPVIVYIISLFKKFLAKILYIVIIALSFLYGVYCLGLSKTDFQTKDYLVFEKKSKAK